MEDYLADLERRLGTLGVDDAPLHVMLSDGGLATVDVARRFPIRMLESGPAAGALAAAAIGAGSGRDELLSFDMGGTTAKLCLIEDGEPLVTHAFEVDRVHRLQPGSGLPIRTPVVDMIEIGVGGGSIARIDALGLLTVGPDSAGSDPGPACYGAGGTEPTVTDADLVLGLLDPDYFLGGRMRLDVDAARRAIGPVVAEPLGVSVEEAAWAIHRAVNEDMANAARVHAVERGRDPRRLPVYAFGGAGPVHGAGVARTLRAGTLVVPAGAGVMSSAGLLTAPMAFAFVRSHRALAEEVTPATAQALFAEMEAEGGELLLASGVARDAIVHRRVVDMRYVGQGFELRVALAADAALPEGLREGFDAAYARRYGGAGPDVGVEVLNWRVTSAGPPPGLRLRPHADPGEGGRSARKWARPIFAGEWLEAAVLDRYALAPGDAVEGPAIVEERESTLVVPPGARCSVADDHSIVVELA